MTGPHAPRRATVRLLLSHPAHFVALGAGSGLSPVAPGTVGTLWAWASFLVLQALWGHGPSADVRWAVLLALSLPVGWWACTHTARSLNVSDPGAVVWDEIVAFWAVLWLITPASWTAQLLAFTLFRFFDAVKPGPVGWADALHKPEPGARPGWVQGWGILFDDLVAAACTLWAFAAVRSLAHHVGGWTL